MFDSLELWRQCGKTIVRKPKGGDGVGDGWALTEMVSAPRRHDVQSFPLGRAHRSRRLPVSVRPVRGGITTPRGFRVAGQQALKARDYRVPGDYSTAAFPLCAGVLAGEVRALLASLARGDGHTPATGRGVRRARPVGLGEHLVRRRHRQPVWADRDDLLLDCEAEAADDLVKRLSIYRLRRPIPLGAALRLEGRLVQRSGRGYRAQVTLHLPDGTLAADGEGTCVLRDAHRPG